MNPTPNLHRAARLVVLAPALCAGLTAFAYSQTCSPQILGSQSTASTVYKVEVEGTRVFCAAN